MSTKRQVHTIDLGTQGSQSQNDPIANLMKLNSENKPFEGHVNA